MFEKRSQEIAEIDDSNREAVLEWLRDRSYFHTWFTSLIVGSFVLLTVFGSRPGFDRVGPVFLSISLVLLLVSILCNLVCVWSIPSWKYRVSTGIVTNAWGMRVELAIVAWIGVGGFVGGLTLGFIGNLPG